MKLDKDDKKMIGAIASHLSEMKNECDGAAIWFEISAPSVQLIKASTKRKLTEVESTKVAGDFLQAGLLLHSMARRNEALIQHGAGFIAHTMSEELDDDLKEFLDRITE